MNIIALFGDNSVGKTHTFNILYDELLKIAGVTSTGKTAFGKRDFEDILNFPLGRKVALFSMGDYSKATIEKINKYNSLGIDTFVCACNNKFKNPIKLISTFPNNIYNKSTTMIKTDYNTLNMTDALNLISLI